MDSNVEHDVESRLRNIESHLGIGNVDEETGEYTVDQADDKPGEGPKEETEETGEEEVQP